MLQCQLEINASSLLIKLKDCKLRMAKSLCLRLARMMTYFGGKPSNFDEFYFSGLAIYLLIQGDFASGATLLSPQRYIEYRLNGGII